MLVSFAIQAHPTRADLAADLAALIPGVQLVLDPEPSAFRSPWRTYRRALELTPRDATHRVVVQDDVTVCRDFPDAVREAVAARPSNPLALFHGGSPRENVAYLDRALRAGERWAALSSRRWVPAVALVWPVELIAPALAFVDEQSWPENFRADDEIIGRAFRELGATVLACVPSIVQHEDVVPSILGRRAKAGLDKGRVAAHWLGVDVCPLELDWSTGAS